MDFKLQLHKKILIIVLAILVLFNLYVIYEYSLNESRLVRLVSSIVFFLIFIYFKGYKNVIITIVFVTIVLSDFLMLGYDSTLYSNLYLVLKAIVYSIIIVSTLKKLFVVGIPFYLKIFSIILIGLSVLLIHYMIINLDKSQISNFTIKLFYIIGLIMLVTVFTTGYYSYVYGSRKAYCISVSMLSFVISDGAAFLAYYLDLESIYYIERLMYLHGLFYLVHYVNKNIKKENISLIREW